MGYRIVRMSAELIEQFFAEGYTMPPRDGTRVRCVKGLPEGAKLVGVSEDGDFGGARLKFSHPSWENEPGETIPEIYVQYTVEDAPPVTANLIHWPALTAELVADAPLSLNLAEEEFAKNFAWELDADAPHVVGG